MKKIHGAKKVILFNPLDLGIDEVNINFNGVKKDSYEKAMLNLNYDLALMRLGSVNLI